MKEKRVTIRIDDDLNDGLTKEAKKRGQTVGALIRTFIVDGLSRYDAATEQILQNGETLERLILRVERVVGANLHSLIEQQVMRNKPHDGESQEAYTKRLRSNYSDRVHKAVEKGSSIKEIA